MRDDRVSVVIPAYRASRTLGRALESLQGQELRPDEVLVVDDGSPDGSEIAGVVAGFGGWVRLIRQDNGGASSARNAGIEASSGELIAFLDADDHWEPSKLRRQVEVFDSEAEVGLVASRYYAEIPGERRDIDRIGPASEPWMDQVVSARGAEAFEMATRVLTSTVMVRRNALGGHRFVSGLEPAEDRDLWVRLIASAPCYYFSEALATYVQEPNSLSRSSVDVDCGNMIEVVRRHSGLLGRRAARSWEADTYRRWAAGHLGQGRPSRAIRPAAGRLVRQPFSVEGWYILAKAAALSVRTSSPRGNTR